MSAGYRGGVGPLPPDLGRALRDADDRDAGWLAGHIALAVSPTGEALPRWLAGVRMFGYPPPPEGACAPDLNERLRRVARSLGFQAGQAARGGPS
jgi:hypothetical protein